MTDGVNAGSRLRQTRRHHRTSAHLPSIAGDKSVPKRPFGTYWRLGKRGHCGAVLGSVGRMN